MGAGSGLGAVACIAAAVARAMAKAASKGTILVAVSISHLDLLAAPWAPSCSLPLFLGVGAGLVVLGATGAAVVAGAAACL